ncbi:dihydrofolate reductase family protein [Planobispora takensis]|uniref:Uncharacterized protein n=1 Tax=Planobispora takensis TaxID=1367882 RepID=A0A8J3WZ26_9ACTN|nr:dihydrofolate reductase family protein [Planobispora takensis]GII04387.1 hypothetical protein Pta02_63950 [Planobispora takensis]
MIHISATMFLTLDGVMEAPHLWHPAYVSEESLAVLAGQLAGATAMLLGRRTYEEFAGYWPHQPDDVPLAAEINGIRKYVLSRTLANPGWGDTTVLGEGVQAAVRTLAEREERVLVAGSARLVRELLDRGLLGVSVAAVTSSVQRARAGLRDRLGPDRARWRRGPALTDHETAVLERYMRAIEAADHRALADLLAPGARVSHQPGAGGHHGAEPIWYGGRAAILERWAPVLHGPYGMSLRMTPTAANRQPAATYIRVPGDGHYRAFSLSVVTVEGGLLTELAQFGPELSPYFRLPGVLTPPG